jgi:Fic family protein
MADDQEFPSRIEPTLLEEVGGDLLDLLTELPAAAGRLGTRLHPKTAASLAALVRVMNCYYSNLIEGHNTLPKDIERALADDFDADEKRRNLQLEARAHIRIQERIDAEAADNTLGDPVRAEFIQRLHLDFYKDAPESMLLIKGAGRSFIMIPGEVRNRPEHDVTVGRHIPPSSEVVKLFMERFAKCYAFSTLRPAQRVLALPSAHHRFNFIHPFPDGNGRVSRLMSHAMAYQADIGAHGLWSISRGLARGLTDKSEYKSMMDHADMPRQGDLDGRGNLSTRALMEFSTWFLKICLDQVTFMERLFDLDTLAERFKRYAMLKNFRPEAGRLLTEILHRGEIARGDASAITGLGERTARDLLGSLLRDGILGSESEKGAVVLRFPVDARDLLFPRLFGEAE